MINSNQDIQKEFFDREQNQYRLDLIVNPPLHSRLEIQIILGKLKNVDRMRYIIDFGAGSGRLTIPLLQHKFSVWAVDVSDASLVSLRNNAQRFSLQSLRISHSLPKGKKFTAIVGTDILHHVDLDKELPSLYDLLLRGGKVVFSEPGAFNLSWYIYLPLFHSWNVEKGVTCCTYSNLKHKFEKYGFRKVRILGLGLLPRPFLNWFGIFCRFNDWLGNLPLIKFFAYRYIIEAYK